MISPESSSSNAAGCKQVVGGNYDVIVNELPDEPNFRSILTNYLERFEHHETELANGPADCSYANEFKSLKEFSRLLKEDKANLLEGEQEYNLRKNRYKDILPFSHTRVVLSASPHTPGSCYINANYVRGPSGSPHAYIACQGPLTCTLNDFWRMIWECGVSVIVMACNEYESGKPKCELYWPQQAEASRCYGDFEVKLVKVRQICSDFLIRKFSVKLLQPETTTNGYSSNIDLPTNAQQPQYDVHSRESNLNQNGSSHDSNNNNSNSNPIYGSIDSYPSRSPSNKLSENQQANADRADARCNRTVLAERIICQFHYTTWPDHGAPDCVQPILELVRLVREVQPTEDKPILVHCSAGCGRTGTICCIDYVWGLLRRGKLDPSFDLYSIICDMRRQRMAMVQTLEQYILCYRVVAALFMRQLNLLDNHVYENLEAIEDGQDYVRANGGGKAFDEQDLGPVFI